MILQTSKLSPTSPHWEVDFVVNRHMKLGASDASHSWIAGQCSAHANVNFLHSVANTCLMAIFQDNPGMLVPDRLHSEFY